MPAAVRAGLAVLLRGSVASTEVTAGLVCWAPSGVNVKGSAVSSPGVTVNEGQMDPSGDLVRLIEIFIEF
jgi:hypothetical protein